MKNRNRRIPATSGRLCLVLSATVCLALSACSGKSKPANNAGEKQAKAEVKAAEPSPHEGKSHGDTKKPPHAPAAGPHGKAKQPKPKGPPRDITPTGKTVDKKIAELKLGIPEEWEDLGPKPPMRVAQYTLPGPGGDGEMVVFRFAGGAGGVEANVNRWKGMFQPPEGKTIDDVAKQSDFKVGDLKVTIVDVTGRYVAAVRPGADDKHDVPDSRMLAAIIEGSGDAFFFKGVGPKKTMDLWADPFDKTLHALSIEKM